MVNSKIWMLSSSKSQSAPFLQPLDMETALEGVRLDNQSRADKALIDNVRGIRQVHGGNVTVGQDRHGTNDGSDGAGALLRHDASSNISRAHIRPSIRNRPSVIHGT